MCAYKWCTLKVLGLTRGGEKKEKEVWSVYFITHYTFHPAHAKRVLKKKIHALINSAYFDNWIIWLGGPLFLSPGRTFMSSDFLIWQGKKVLMYLLCLDWVEVCFRNLYNFSMLRISNKSKHKKVFFFVCFFFK